MLILASASPRRKDLLRQIILDFAVVPSRYDEAYKDLSPADYAEDCALQKAREVYGRLQDERATVIGADTVVIKDGVIYGKPKDSAEAERMLRSLSGTTHSVITGVCIKTVRDEVCGFEESLVTFLPFTEAEIKEYIATGSPFDKAGAYGIQDLMIMRKTESVKGGIDNVMGLPVKLVKTLLYSLKGGA